MSTAMTFPAASPESLGIPSAAIERYLDHVRDNRLEVNSLMIIRHGKLAASGWWAPYTAERLHAAHSLTKSFTSTAIGLMIREGLVRLHDRVADLFPADMPDNPSENLLRMDLWHLLTMTCGHETEAVPGTETNYAKAFLAHPVPREPGTHYIYNSMASYMLTVLIYEKTGQNLLDYLRPRVLEPLGCGDMFCLTCPRGIENGGGGLHIRTVDIARMAQLYLQKGRHNGVQLIPESWIDEASSWQVSTANHPAGDGDHVSGFGYHIWRCIPPDVYRFAGANGQFGIVMPTKDAVIAVTASSWNTAGITEGLWDIVLPAMADGPLPEDPAAAERLRSRMAGLALDWTPARRDAAAEQALGGRTLTWPDNHFSFSLRRGGADTGVSSSTITFSEDRAMLDYLAGGVPGRLVLGLDGRPVENAAAYAGHSFPVLATGAWTADGAFRVDLRSIVSVAHRRVFFRPADGGVAIRIESTPNTDALTNPPPTELKAVFQTGLDQMAQLKDFFRKYGWIYLPGLLVLVVSSYIQTLQPRILGTIIDTLEATPNDSRAVRNSLLLLLLIAFLTFVTRFAWRYIIMGNSRNMESYLRKRLFAHLQTQPPEFFNHQKTGDLMAYAINDINAIRMTFGPSLALGVSGITIAILSVAGMSGGVDSRLTMFALLPIPVVVTIVVFMGRQVQRRFRRVQETFAAVSDRVQEDISGIRVIKAYVQEEEEAERFEALNRRSRQVNLDMIKVSASMRPVIMLLFGISFTISLIYGGSLVRNGTITVGDFVAFNGYLTLIVMPIQSIARIITIIQRGLASLKRYNGILDIRPAVVDGAGDAPAASMGEGLEISGLTFVYPGTSIPALADIDIRLEPGNSLGVVGRTGSGKTTLVMLLSKMYNAPDGTIRFGGWDINRFSLETLRSAIACVPQDNFLFSASIAENIRFFDDGFSQDQIADAARQACIDDSIRLFPDGYDTQVGERGMSLSGGQKQRIAIARALLRDTPLLILDDALSAVDTRTEESILENLHERKRSRQSSVIVSHRISAVMACDEIVVLDAGRIVERGTHAELVAAGGFYAQTAASQADSGEGEPV